MNFLVSNEVGVLPKASPTVDALIRPFPSMNSPMFNEAGVVSKGLPTFTALVRLFSSVNSLMNNERGAVFNTFPTLAALITHWPRVNCLVVNEARPLSKEPPTCKMITEACSTVDFLVLNKHVFVAKGFPTFITLVVIFILLTFKGLSALSVVWLPSVVRGLVLGEVCARWEVCPTLHVWEGSRCSVSAAGPPLIPSRQFLSILLLMVLGETCYTYVHLLLRVCSSGFSQAQNVL